MVGVMKDFVVIALTNHDEAAICLLWSSCHVIFISWT